MAPKVYPARPGTTAVAQSPGMKIVYACYAALEQGPAGPTSKMASMRYRAVLPARELRRLGHDVRIVVAGEGAWSDAEVEALRCDVLVISKSFNAATEELAAKLRERGARIVVDVCDYHFGHPEHGEHFARLIAMADQLVAASEGMAAALRQHAGRESTVISDPVEGVKRAPAFAPRPPFLRLIWFGNVLSAMSLAERVGELHALGAERPTRLVVMTAPAPPVLALVDRINREAAQGRVRAVFAEWSEAAIGPALLGNEVVWLTSLGGEREAVKSPNRLLEGLWAGRLVVADPVPSYQPFAGYAQIGTGLAAGVREAMADPAMTLARLIAGQAAVERDHAPAVIGQRWADALV
jgi:hypothetical protein